MQITALPVRIWRCDRMEFNQAMLMEMLTVRARSFSQTGVMQVIILGISLQWASWCLGGGFGVMIMKKCQMLKMSLRGGRISSLTGGGRK